MKKINKYRVLAMMSGTSLDGLDLVICDFIKQENWRYKLLKAKTIKYNRYWTQTLENLHKKNKKEIKKIDMSYAIFLANEIKFFAKNHRIDLIASHGHTIFHEPEKKITLQIGDGEKIANETKIITVSNFRKLDVSLNGNGAPLVPIGDLYLFKNYKYCINLGGFANISVKEKNKIFAFDICPLNIILNKYSRKLGYEYDDDGIIAKKGKIIKQLLENLNNLKYYIFDNPKSLSREWVEKNIYPLIHEKYSNEDILRTFCEHAAIQIGKKITCNKALFTGGGTYNSFLMQRIEHYSKSKIYIPDKKTIEFKEAIIFGLLGVLKIRNEINCLKTVTGAIKNSSCGEINKPY
tara:strand:- start:4301 stop:5350 length:1050 start_codon:yes stop_codon:yes gene_type:complete